MLSSDLFREAIKQGKTLLDNQPGGGAFKTTDSRLFTRFTQREVGEHSQTHAHTHTPDAVKCTEDGESHATPSARGLDGNI